MNGERVAELIRALHAETSGPALASTKPSARAMCEAAIRAEKRRFIELREGLGLSRRRAAHILGLAPATIDGWEHMGDLTREPKPSVFERLPRLVADLERTG